MPEKKLKKTILLVEDEPVASAVTSRIITKAGYTVLNANSGKMAVQMAGSCAQIDLILMDIDLGEGIDGPEAARQILLNCHIPIVFLTSHSEKEYVDRVKEITRYGYVLKGSSAFVLQEAIQMAFELFENHEILGRKESMQNAIISSISDVITVLNRNGVVTYVSPNIRKWFGWTPEEITGSEIWGNIHPDDTYATSDLLNRTITEPESSVTAECRYRYSDGRYRWIEYTAKNCFNVPEINGILINYRDITDQKNSQESLKEREYTLQKIFDIIPVGLWFADKKGKLLRGNPTGKKIWGAEPKVDPENYGVFKARRLPSGEEIAPEEWALAHTITKGATIENELLEIDAFDGVTRTILNFTAPILDDNGDITGAIVVNHDISEQREMESELNDSLDRFKALHEASFGGIAIHEKGVIIECNKGLSDLTGYSMKELIGMNGLNLVAPENMDKVKNNILNDYPDPYEVKGLRKDGTIYDLRIQGKSIPYKGSKVRVTEFRDISESKAAQESIKIKNEELEALNEELTASMEEMEATNEEFARANEELIEANTRLIQMEKNLKKSLDDLELSESRYRLIAENVVDVIWTTDMNLDLTYISPSVERQQGYTADEMKGISLDKRFPPHSIKLISEIMAREMEKEKDPASDKSRAVSFEAEAFKKDASIYWADFNLKFLRDADGNPNGFQGITRDITERKESELKISDLLKEKEILLKEVHHRIKNNMNTICGLLMIQAETLEDESVKNALYDASTRVQSMMVLYDKLYRSEDFREVSLKEYFPPLIDEVIKNFHSAESVTILKEIDDIILHTDILSPLGIILSELITNIMKHAFKNKTGGIIKVSAKQENNTFSITVEDNGMGIPENVDIHNSPGFGLQLISMLTEQISGNIEVDRIGGTSVTITLKKQ